MKVYLETKTLDGYVDDLDLTTDKTEAEIVLIGSRKFDLKPFVNAKGIFRTGAGKDNIPWDDAKDMNVDVGFPSVDTTDVIFRETANFTCNAILRWCYRSVGELESWTKFNRKALNSYKLLVVGTGNIGTQVCEKMKNFMDVSTFDILKNQTSEFEDLVKKSDIVSLHIPLNDRTRGFFGEVELSYMKNDSLLVNTARGPIVDEEALNKELMANRLSATFDVFWEEPYRGKLKSLHPNPFYMTPHISSTCKEFLEGMNYDFREFIKNL